MSFDVPAGCGFVILGRSGTGKSVTLRHIIGLVTARQRDACSSQGDEVSALTGRSCRACAKSIGFLFQNAALFDSISVGENVAFPDAPAHHARRRARSAAVRSEKLAAVGLEREYDKMPAALSGGMRKRAGLARALALDPPILLVDEPSAGLDPITADEIDDAAARAQAAGRHDAHRRHPQHPERAAARRRAGDAARGADRRAAAPPTELDRSDDELVRAFMASQHAG